jgi:hypothetical protein
MLANQQTSTIDGKARDIIDTLNLAEVIRKSLFKFTGSLSP